MKNFWNRLRGDTMDIGALVQRVFDRFANALVVKTTPGQPRYYDLKGAPLAELDVDTVAAAALDAGIQEDNSGAPDFTDLTAELADATADDVPFFPAGAGEDDAFYFGSALRFETLTINVSTAGTGTYTLTWEYSRGDGTWGTLSVTDNTTDFKTGGSNTVTFTAPHDWVKDTINDQGPYFYVRARRDDGTVTQDPLGQQATATPHTVPNIDYEPTFFGAHYAGKTAFRWVADAPGDTVSFEVYCRTDKALQERIQRSNAPDEFAFVGDYVLVQTVANLADLAEVIVDTGYRPVYARPTTTDSGKLTIGVA